MTKKIFRSIVLVAASVLLASLVIILSCFYDYFARLQKQQLKDELYLAAASVEESGVLYLQNLSSESFRLTLVAKNGSVIYDTAVDAKTLEDHTDREEIKEAFETGRGESVPERGKSVKGRGSGETIHFVLLSGSLPPCQGLSLWESCQGR